MRIAPAISLSSDQQANLEQWARSRSLPARVVERARIVLLAAQGQQDKQIAAALKITPKKVSRCRARFLTITGVNATSSTLTNINNRAFRATPIFATTSSSKSIEFP
jgi:FixJ family two-component response regulator